MRHEGVGWTHGARMHPTKWRRWSCEIKMSLEREEKLSGEGGAVEQGGAQREKVGEMQREKVGEMQREKRCGILKSKE